MGQTLHIKPKLDHVAVLHFVFLAFDPQLTRFTSLGLAAESGEVVVVNYFGGDEAAFEIGVNDAGGFGALAPAGMVQARVSFSPVVR